MVVALLCCVTAAEGQRNVRYADVDEFPSIMPVDLDLGPISGCLSEVDTFVTVANPGAPALTIASIDGGGIVTPLTPLPLLLDAGEEISFRIRVRPGVTGPFAKRVAVHVSGSARTAEFTVRGDHRGVVFAHVDTIDFGEVLTCSDTTLSFPFALTYGGGGTKRGQVGGVLIEGPFSVDSIGGVFLDSGLAYRTRIHFAPPRNGSFIGRIRLQLDPCSIDREVILLGRRLPAPVVLSGDDLDYGAVPPGGDTPGDLFFTNQGRTPITVESITGPSLPFAIEETIPPLPARLDPGESVRVVVIYLPTPGRWLDTVRLHTADPCPSVSVAAVRARTDTLEIGGAEVHLKIVDIACRPGERARLSVLLSDANALASTPVQSIEISLRFDASLLFTPSSRPGVMVLPDSSGWRRLLLRGPIVAAGSEIAGADVVAMVGLNDTTPLLIDGFRWLDEFGNDVPEIATIPENGVFILSGVCGQGGRRRVDGSGTLSLKTLSSLPPHGAMVVEYGLVEGGEVRIELIDMNGCLLRELMRGDPGPGVYRLEIDTRSLPAGSYLLLLASHGDRIVTGTVIP